MIIVYRKVSGFCKYGKSKGHLLLVLFELSTGDKGRESISVISLNVGGSITVMQASPDYSYLALCIDDDRRTRMVVFDTDTYQVSAEFDMDIIASEMRISATNEIIWTVQYDARLFTLICYALPEGKVIASGKVNVEMPATWWQVSCSKSGQQLQLHSSNPRQEDTHMQMAEAKRK